MLLAGHFSKAAVTTTGPTYRTDVAVVTGNLICPNDDLAAIAIGQRIGSNRRVASDKGARGIAYTCIRALEIATDQHFAAAINARSINVCAGG